MCFFNDMISLVNEKMFLRLYMINIELIIYDTIYDWKHIYDMIWLVNDNDLMVSIWSIWL